MDGEPIGNAVDELPITPNLSPLRLGRSADDEALFNGVLDELRIYKRSLTLAELKALYEFEKSERAPLIRGLAE